MLTSHSCRRLVVANCLGLSLVLGFQDISLAAGLQRVSANAAVGSDGLQTVDQNRGDRPILRLAWLDAAGLSEACTDRLKWRVEEIFEEMGVVIEWHEPRSVSTEADAVEPYYLKVILLDKEPAAMGYPATAMGIRIGTDFPPDAVFLFEPLIQNALRGSTRSRRPLSAVELGRAYARVLAHEVVHAVANDRRHADRGLMAAVQNHHVLTSPDAEVDPESATAFYEGLRRIYSTLAIRQQTR